MSFSLKQKGFGVFVCLSLVVAVEVGASVVLTLPDASALPVKTYYGMDNKASGLSWGASYELMSYLANYRATRNLSNLAGFLVYAENVRSKRDDALNYNLKAKTWSSSNYTRGVPYATLVGDGMISYAFADFAALVLVHDKDLQAVVVPALGKTLLQIANEYHLVAKEAVAAHEAERNSNGSYRALSSTSSYFLDSLGRPISGHYELPFNMYLAMGRTLIKLAEIPDPMQATYKSIAYSMAGRFMSWISDRTGYPYWVYWSRDATIEDVSHGHIDVDFMRLYLEAGLPGMQWRDIGNLTYTFVYKAYQGAGVVSYDILGQNLSSSPDYRDSMSWMMLSNYNLNVKLIGIDASRRLAASSPSSATTGYGAFVYALAAEFGGRQANGSSCTLASQCQSGICHPTNAALVSSNLYQASQMTCQAFFSYAHTCQSHFECASGLCDFSKNNEIDLQIASLARKSRFGTCLYR